jgi:hypothetical protein
MRNYFLKYQEDIINACKNIYGDIRFEGILNDLNKQLSPLLNEILNSYYFENCYNSEINNKKDDFEIIFNGLKFKPFLIEYYESITTNKSYKKIDFNIEDIKKELLKIDPFYKIIFEEDSIRKKLYLKNKNNIEYSIVDVKEDVFSIFNDYHKIYQFKPSFFDQESPLDRANKKVNFDCEINDVQEIDFFSNFNNKNRKFIVAHNSIQIVGLLSLTNYKMYFNENENTSFMRDKFIFNSYVSVSNHFKNKGIATKMMLISMDIAKKNNLIYVRSKPTNEGSLCIEKKIDKLMIENDITHVNSESVEVLGYVSDIVKSISNKEEYCKFIPEFKNLFNYINKLNFESEKFLDNEESYEKRVQYIEENQIKINKIVKEFKEKFIKISPKENKNKLKI